MKTSLLVKDVVFESFDKKDRTYQCILTFLNGSQTRLFCRENAETKKMEPFNVGIMNGRCPCCYKPTCKSLESRQEELFEQVLEIKPEAKEFEAGNLND